MADKTVDVMRPRPVDDVIDDIDKHVVWVAVDDMPNGKEFELARSNTRKLCLELVQAVRWEMVEELEVKFGSENSSW